MQQVLPFMLPPQSSYWWTVTGEEVVKKDEGNSRQERGKADGGLCANTQSGQAWICCPIMWYHNWLHWGMSANPQFHSWRTLKVREITFVVIQRHGLLFCCYPVPTVTGKRNNNIAFSHINSHFLMEGKRRKSPLLKTGGAMLDCMRTCSTFAFIQIKYPTCITRYFQT